MVDLLSHLFDICYRDLLEVGFIAVECNVKITCPAVSWRLPQPGTFPTALSVQCTELRRTSCIVYIAGRAIQSSALRTTERIYIYIYIYIYAVPNDTVNIQYAYLLASQQNNPYPIKFEGRFSQKPQLSEP